MDPWPSTWPLFRSRPDRACTGRSLDVVLVGENYNRMRTHKAAVLFESSEIEGNIRHRSRQNAAGGTAREVGLERMAVLHAAAEFINQLAHGDAGRRQLHARILHAA